MMEVEVALGRGDDGRSICKLSEGYFLYARAGGISCFFFAVGGAVMTIYVMTFIGVHALAVLRSAYQLSLLKFTDIRDLLIS